VFVFHLWLLSASKNVFFPHFSPLVNKLADHFFQKPAPALKTSSIRLFKTLLTRFCRYLIDRPKNGIRFNKYTTNFSGCKFASVIQFLNLCIKGTKIPQKDDESRGKVRYRKVCYCPKSWG